jgi:S-adenosylmethionine:tRNA ribosyltransferase-isomerase
MNVSDFDFELPDELIAQHPPTTRGASRLLVLDRRAGVDHTLFAELGRYLVAGDLLVLNDTRVFSARLLGRRVPSGGSVECLLLKRELPEPGRRIPHPGGIRSPSAIPDPGTIRDPRQTATCREEIWSALVHPGQKLKTGAGMLFERDGIRVTGEVLAMHFQGRRTVRLSTDHAGGLADAIDRIGHIPLPPYIKRDDVDADKERYQTIYARERGSVAAPTAGLHFTRAQLEDLAARGIERAEVTLHVGYGTFKPVKADRVDEHVVDAERYTVTSTAAAALTRAKRERRRIVAVGTTTVRTLESLEVTVDGEVRAGSGNTTLFIRPGHTFRVVDALITNFHLPRSSLVMLVSAFAGRARLLAAYREAVEHGYRFYSYGDAMLIL